MRIFSKFRVEFTYPDGFGSLIRKAPQQRPIYIGTAELLEELTREGIGNLCHTTIEQTSSELIDSPETAEEKYRNICSEFEGSSKLLAVHALVIAASRRRDTPQAARDLFQELWRTQSKFLLEHLDTRWKLSALQSFRDIGTNEAQRRCAGELIVFFNMMKLYESERCYSGTAPETPFDPHTKAHGRLPLKLKHYSVQNGDLDRNMLGMLWLAAEQDPVLEPLACHLLTAINRDKSNVFRRLRLMRRVLKGK